MRKSIKIFVTTNSSNAFNIFDDTLSRVLNFHADLRSFLTNKAAEGGRKTLGKKKKKDEKHSRPVIGDAI